MLLVVCWCSLIFVLVCRMMIIACRVFEGPSFVVVSLFVVVCSVLSCVV